MSRASTEWSSPAPGHAATAGSPRLEERLGWPVHITVMPPADWDDETSGFVLDVRRRPHLETPVTTGRSQ